MWCVFDVDEHPYIPEAKALAQQHGIYLAVSNPYFELWLLLHHREQPGAQHRHKLQAMMKEYVEGYDKHIDFALSFEPYVEQAQRRAARLERDNEQLGEPDKNPSTSVHHLLKAMGAKASG